MEWQADQQARMVQRYNGISLEGTSPSSRTISEAHVDVTPLPLLFHESFETYTDVELSNPNGGWAAVDPAGGGWISSGSNTEVAHTDYYGTINASDGDYWLDTLATDGPIDIKHSVTDPTGGKMQVSFDLGTENFRIADEHGLESTATATMTATGINEEIQSFTKLPAALPVQVLPTGLRPHPPCDAVFPAAMGVVGPGRCARRINRPLHDTD